MAEMVWFVGDEPIPALIEATEDGGYWVRAYAFNAWMFVMPDGNVHIEAMRYQTRAEAEAAVQARLALVERLRTEGVTVHQ